MENKKPLLALGAICVVIILAVLVEWRSAQDQPAPGLAQIAVTQPIRAELLKIGRAQQFYYAENSRYGSLEELISSGALAMKSPSRGVYHYTAEAGERGFVVTAQAQGEEAGRWPVLSINERMEISEQPATAGRK